MTLDVAIMERRWQPLEGIEVTQPFCTLCPSFDLRGCRVFRQVQIFSCGSRSKCLGLPLKRPRSESGWETAEPSGVLECIAAPRLTNEATSWSSSSLVQGPGLDAAAAALGALLYLDGERCYLSISCARVTLFAIPSLESLVTDLGASTIFAALETPPTFGVAARCHLTCTNPVERE
ncbi:hypothetical protein FRC08_017944 [Ceratobasidium sp. 394]|nr:hypothetical protein FRC08_017944 [Ceratobasidium sp. 394]